MPFGTGRPIYIPSLTWQCNPQVGRLVRDAGPRAKIVDLGAGARRIAPLVTTVDFAAMEGTDVVSDAKATPFPDASFDLVIATGLLEHVEDDDALLREMCRLLKVGGLAHVEVPFLQRFHADPIDFRRWTVPGLKAAMETFGLEVVEAGVHIGPTVTLIALTANYLSLLFEGRTLAHKIASDGIYLIASYVLAPLKYLDRWVARRPSAHHLAFGIYCTARRRAVPSTIADLAAEERSRRPEKDEVLTSVKR